MDDLTYEAVPEPDSLVLLSGGLLALRSVFRKRLAPEFPNC
jgi:hypothetical protein